MGKIEKRNNRFFCEIPKEVLDKLGLKEGDWIEFLNVYKDLFVLAPRKPKLTEEEINLLQKIGKIRYNERTKERVERILSHKEKDLLSELKKKEIVFEYKKSGRTLYGISRDYFHYAVGSNGKKEFKYGIFTEENMQKFLKEYEDSIKAGDIKIIKGFDKKYYAISTNVLDTVRQRILKEIESTEKSVKDLSEKTGLEEELCKCALEILKEEGTVFEKKKGWYKSVESGV